jgi:alginate O-acetyltransferase complex protein AlgI
MIFNSISFFLFFTLFFLLYWLLFKNSLQLQNLLVLTGSYVFYAFWDWRFLFLMAASSLLNYYLGIYIAKSKNQKQRKLLLYTGLLQGIGMLVFFKYYNFFVTSFVGAFSVFNISLEAHTLQLILPLGISFYSFRAMSYLLDIDKEAIQPTTNPVIFFSYISFFPSLVSGPIDRANLLIPQLEKKRLFTYDQAANGMRQILWGLFKKIVVADNCAVITNQIFDNYASLPASSLVLGACIYSVQLYADFSGYSDMAIGFARLLGFNITKNFNFPYFAQNIASFWQRWHMSLTSWMTEYIYTPLSFIFRRRGKAGLIAAILLNFLIIGLWHGANWTFVCFGFLHGCYFIPMIMRGTINKKEKLQHKKLLPSFSELRNMVFTFLLVAITNVIFRADNMTHAINYYRHIFSASLFSFPVFKTNMNTSAGIVFACIALFIEWLGRDKEYALATLFSKFPKPIRWAFYYAIALVIFLFAGKEQQFIYLQF